MKKTKYAGIIPPLVTPLGDDYCLDREALYKLIHHCINGGVSGVFINGTSGEALRVSEQVWEAVTKETLSIIDGKMPVFCGAIDTSTDRTIERIKRLEAMGGEIAVCTPPFYLASFGQDEILRHYDKICNSTSLEIAVYNIPENTHANILPETIEKLADYDRIVAYKDSTADWQQLQRAIMLLRDKNISVFNGAEELCAVSMLYGVSGCIPGLANFVPELFTQLLAICQGGDVAKSYELQKKINDIRKCIFVSGCWMSGMKALLDVFELGQDYVSVPLLQLKKQEKDDMVGILRRNGIVL